MDGIGISEIVFNISHPVIHGRTISLKYDLHTEKIIGLDEQDISSDIAFGIGQLVGPIIKAIKAVL